MPRRGTEITPNYHALGWVSTTVDGDTTVPAGIWFDVVSVPAASSGAVLTELSISLLAAAAILDRQQGRTGILTAPATGVTSGQGVLVDLINQHPELALDPPNVIGERIISCLRNLPGRP